MKVISKEEIAKRGLQECFGSCLGGTECWESCGDGESNVYVLCLLQAKARVDEAIETEIGERFDCPELLEE